VGGRSLSAVKYKIFCSFGHCQSLLSLRGGSRRGVLHVRWEIIAMGEGGLS
jgi:hypothetical protein